MMTRTTRAKARSFGIPACRRLCTGHTMAMMKRAPATGAKTVLAKYRAEKTAMIATTTAARKPVSALDLACHAVSAIQKGPANARGRPLGRKRVKRMLCKSQGQCPAPSGRQSDRERNQQHAGHSLQRACAHRAASAALQTGSAVPKEKADGSDHAGFDRRAAEHGRGRDRRSRVGRRDPHVQRYQTDLHAEAP